MSTVGSQVAPAAEPRAPRAAPTLDGGELRASGGHGADAALVAAVEHPGEEPAHQHEPQPGTPPAPPPGNVVDARLQPLLGDHMDTDTLHVVLAF